MNATGYNVLSALCVIGAVTVIVLRGDEVVAASLVGLAGTIAGRGGKGER